MTTIHLTEAAGGVTTAPDSTSGRLAVQIINPGWGSSGFYSPQVLEAAATARVFPAGTHMYLDHPSESERFDRPERSVKDLAAILVEDAKWNGQALVAPVQVFGPYREVLAEMKDAIGVSIRAAAEVTENGEAEGRTGRIVDRLVEGVSVDFVTHAGRGGKILQVLESARAKPVERAVRRGVAEATANETREHLQAALTEAYGADRTWLWVRDFDDTTVWFDLETPDDLGTWQQAYTTSDTGVTLTGARVEVRAETRYVPITAPAPVSPTDVPVTTSTTTAEAASPAHIPPVTDHPAGQHHTTHESQGGTTMAEIEEARLRQLEADAGRVPTLEAERDTARSELAIERARNTARPVITEAMKGTTLPAPVIARVTEALVAGVTVTDTGALDEAALKTAAEAARTQAETEVAAIAESLGAGRVTGFGATAPADGISEAELDRRLGITTVKGA